MKSLNIMKKLNKTTKQKRKKKHFSTNFKGKVIDGVHELYTLTAGMMLGIRYAVDQVRDRLTCISTYHLNIHTHP
ncbi:hypothetical protein EON63_24075 [archaeon]|nr:MAG: hypothetical protein EON63_24075 [archaeon]